ncbi:hypothetical protein SASPL_157481 [Salvia splendens]|uniref:S-protein homolog n=1 Tax=Salvia splendens TaxID=180675 RepID=A0A8X8VUV2_SALSN|nr:hypothetical protein SASPL_157481 [Salvia splendens]
MMKYNLFILIASSLLLQATLSRSLCISAHYDVYIRNSLPAGSPPLNVHCFSGDDDLGYHDLTQNAEYHFDFCEKPFATMFACHFKWNGKDKSFHVYDAAHGVSNGTERKRLVFHLPPNSPPQQVHCSSKDADLGYQYHTLETKRVFVFMTRIEIIIDVETDVMGHSYYAMVAEGSPPLNVHCFSGDDDLGYHDLTQNAEYHFDFCEKPFATMFACHFKWNGKDKSFHVYDAAHGGYILCNNGICYYSVASDGFHFSNVYPPNQGRFLCDWNPNTSCN